jgi:tyrosine-specific transport protein
MRSLEAFRSIFGATLLITGCCIGAGMIGLPLRSAAAGFLPSVVTMALCYLFTTITGLFIAEATLWFEGQVNLPTIVESTLGKKGKYLTLFLFLALFYSLFVAYLDGSGVIFSNILSSVTGHAISKQVGIIVCAILVAGITYAGTHLANRLNQVLLLGLVISYVSLIMIGLTHASVPHEVNAHLMPMLNVIPIMLICFGYQNLVPSVIHYLKRNVNHIRFSIIIGNLIPLFVYALWNYVILGILPHDFAMGQNEEIITQILQSTMPIVSIVILIKSFSLLAMLTSFIPNAISLVDFIKDGMHRSLTQGMKSNIFCIFLIFIPSIFFTMTYPNLFLKMLDFAGGFVDVLLFGILPATVILVGRKKMVSEHYQVFGGVVTPIFIILISLLILIIKVGIFYR